MTVATRLKANGVGVCATLAVFVAGLLWAKWLPYVAKAAKAQRTRHWSGSSILKVGGVRAGDGPTWHAATTFFHAYLGSIWPALVVALLLSASIQALLPGSWPARVLNRGRPVSSALAGAVAGMPSMMCTCCAAPVAVTLRRNGVGLPAAVAYWLGNPLLNPAVLVFLLFVAPWQWTVTRAVVGLAVVLGVGALVGSVTGGPPATVAAPGDEGGRGPRGFTWALLRLSAILLPEYAVLVLLVGAFRGWLLAAGQSTHPGGDGFLTGLLVVAVAAIVGTLMVIPTAGEIPILSGLALLGASSGTIGALLVTLPAASIPGVAMVARSFGWRATAVTASSVMAAGFLGAAVLTLL
ncbi:hypothetical protein MPRM_20830 [Mycobacterium parmense]|uniref:Permease n=1 Tax=Mycobacterium parmense TaxID=185642 RepID=A0A7I7YUB0_9MYCO|nr:hypothetical protein MPRM_20830 [Mycobacterium parmense]